MAVTEKSKRIVWHQAGGRCAICREELLMSSDDPTTQSFVGDIAHVVAQKNDGPRGKSLLKAVQRDAPENLILLCATHHRLVDDQEKTYPVKKLLSLKSAHEGWVRAMLSSPKKLDLKLANLHYLNVPRLAMLAALQRLVFDTTAIMRVGNFKDMGYLIPTLIAFNQLLNSLAVSAIELTKVANINDDLIGITLEFNERFRTKNIGALSHGQAVQFTGNLAKDPHIYLKMKDFKLVLRIDPRWVTTSTAFVEFTSGQARFAGLCTVTNVDLANKLIFGTPLVVGVPRSPIMDAFRAALDGS